MKRTKWFEREFEFNLPAGVFPCVVERLRGTPARLEELVRALPPRALTARRDGAWSIQEHVGHLLDLDELHEGRLEDYARRLDTLRPADMDNRKTYEADHNDARRHQTAVIPAGAPGRRAPGRRRGTCSRSRPRHTRWPR